MRISNEAADANRQRSETFASCSRTAPTPFPPAATSSHPLRVHFKGVATLHSQFAFEIYNWHNAPATEAELTLPPSAPRLGQLTLH